MKKSLFHDLMDHDTSTPVNITMPVSSTIGAATPSTPSVSDMPMSPNFHGPGMLSHRHVLSKRAPSPSK